MLPKDKLWLSRFVRPIGVMMVAVAEAEAVACAFTFVAKHPSTRAATIHLMGVIFFILILDFCFCF
jgi:hypothetical protein